MSDRYEAVVTREGDWWLATVRGLEGAHTEARTLARLDRYLREVIVLAADLPDEAMDGVEIEWRYELEAPEVEAALRSARQARLVLTEDERRAAESTAKALTALDRLSPHVSDRDAAVLLGLSHQRVTQLRGSRRRARRSAA